MIAERRGKNVAITGAVVQLGLAAVLLGVWLVTGSNVALAGGLMSVAGLPLWLMVTMLQYCRQLASREQAEFDELTQQGATTGTIFELKEGEELRPAASRVAFMQRWIVPIFTLIWAALHIAFGTLLFLYFDGTNPQLVFGSLMGDAFYEVSHSQPAILLVIVAGFAAFLFSRYATGMGRAPQWRLLRSAGSYLLITVLFAAALLASLIMAWQGMHSVDLVIAYFMPLVQLALACELILNFVLELYRPRLPGQEYQPSFESRLFCLVAEPEQVGHSIAETLNYQFGFEVSKTWFYQLTSRAFLPLAFFGALVLTGMSSIVLVRDGEQHVVLHWGSPDRILDAGLHFKWPWPIDTTKNFNVGRVHDFTLGLGSDSGSEDDHGHDEESSGQKIFLWAEEHDHGEYKEQDFLIAASVGAEKKSRYKSEEEAPPVQIIKLVIPVHYQIKDVIKWGFGAQDPARLLMAEAHREMVRYCASATLDSPAPGGAKDRPEAIMTYGRRRIAKELKTRIQAAADRLDLGVKITYVGLLSAHPPVDAAEAFENVLKAERQRDHQRSEAKAEAAKILIAAAGDARLASELAARIQMIEELRSLERSVEAPADLKARLREASRAAASRLVVFEREIAEEKLLGLVRDDQMTTQQVLRDVTGKYVELLNRIKSAPATFDYAGEIASMDTRITELFDSTSGQAAVLAAQAEAGRWWQELTERGRYESFLREVQAFRASPQVYALDRKLDVLDATLPKIRKYIIGTDRDRVEIRLNWEQEAELMAGVYEETK